MANSPIAGYTNHWFEEEYIQVLHNNLIHKIRKLQDNLRKTVNMMDEDGEDFWDPTFVQSLKDFCEGPLEDAWSNIFVHTNVVVHSLKYDALLHIEPDGVST